jgi:hypothetical protein
LSSSRGVRLDTAGLDPDAVFPATEARLVLNLMLLAAECLPGGGTIALAGTPGESVAATIAGPRASWPTGLAGWLHDEAAAWEALLAEPRRLQVPLTVLLVRRLGARLSMLMPTGPVGEADTAPPLLLSLRRE